MAHRLMKEEPAHDAFEDLVRDVETVWDGVSNALALERLRSARRGADVLVHHTGAVRAAVGLATIVRGPHPDPGAGEPRLAAVTLKTGRPLPRPETLAARRANPRLSGFDQIRIPRLPAVPVAPEHGREILRMAGMGR